MSADCYFTCDITLIFLDMISGYLETKEKKICWFCCELQWTEITSIYEWKISFLEDAIPILMLHFFHAFVLCNVMGTDQTEVSTVINNAFFNNLLSACFFTVTPNSNSRLLVLI